VTSGAAVHDVVIAGAGLFGIVCAERLAAHRLSVLLVEREPEVGGLCRSQRHSCGVEFNPYGTHVISTDDERVWRYLSRFTVLLPYRHIVHARVGGRLVPMPIGLEAIRLCYRRDLGPAEARQVVDADANPYRGREVRTVRDAALAALGPRLYGMFVAGYVTKQWGVPPAGLDARVFTSRFAIHYGTACGYLRRRFQGLPGRGYAAMFARMLDSPRIEVARGVDFLAERPAFRYGCVYTGPIDAFFDHAYGTLARHRVAVDWTLTDPSDCPTVSVVTHPGDDVPHYRTHRPDLLPWNTNASARSVMIGREHSGPGQYPIEFVVRTAANAALLNRYRTRAARMAGHVFAGRGAGEDLYLDMGATVSAAFRCAARLADRIGVRDRVSA
jgi:UDP-galactopyranose mutase